jgi:GT2 family glycosyltransferase
VTFEVIIPTIRARPDLLAACIEGVRETTGQKPVVVEGGTFAENCNQGAEGTDAEIVVFLNDDCELLAGWLSPLIEAFDNPNTVIAGPKLVYPDGRIQHAGVGFRDRDGLLEAYNILDDLPSRYVEAVTGACMAVRTSTFRELGGFDTGYVNGYEDVDFCIRADTDDESIRYVAESVVIHHESQSGPARWTHVRQNIARLQRWNA